MPRAPKVSRALVLAVRRPPPALEVEWLAAAVGMALVLAALLS